MLTGSCHYVTTLLLPRAPVAVGIVLVWSFGAWFCPVIGARHWFKGPPVAMEVAEAQQQLFSGPGGKHEEHS